VRPVRPPSGSDDANAESLRCHVLRPPGSAADAAARPRDIVDCRQHFHRGLPRTHPSI